MKKIYIALPLLCSLPALQACISTLPKTEIWGMKPVYSVQHGGGNARDYYQLGKYFQGQNRLEQAAEAYQKALLIDSTHLEAHNALGAIYSTQGKFEQAIVEFNSVIERSPQAAHLHNNLGYTYFLQKKFPEAIESFEKALALDPSHERSLNNLAQAYSENGNPEKATEILARVDTLKGKTNPPPAIAMATAQPPADPALTAQPAVAATKPVDQAPPLAAAQAAQPTKLAMTVAPTPMQKLEKMAPAERTALLTVAPTPMEKLEKLAPTERTALLAAVPDIVTARPASDSATEKNSVSAPPKTTVVNTTQAIEVAAVKVDAATSAPVVSVQSNTAQPAAEKTQALVASATPTTSGFSVMAELQTELKPLPLDRNLLALMVASTPIVKTNKPEAISTPAHAVAKAVVREDKTTFEKITEAALQELTPNSVKLKAAKEMVAGIFRSVETAFSDLVHGKPFRLEIANGNGVSGLAKKVNDILSSNGVPTAQITNHKNYQQRQTVVQYRNGYQVQATALSQGLRNKPQMVETANLRTSTDVRLVLGRDVSTQTALFDAEPSTTQIAGNVYQISSIE
jgi:Flp pilus assembly protein TadD